MKTLVFGVKLFVLIVLLVFELFVNSCTNTSTSISTISSQQLDLSSSVKKIVNDTTRVTPVIDSLKAELKLANDSTQLMIIGELAENWRSNTLLLANEQYLKSDLLNYELGKASALCKFGIYYTRNFNLDSANYFFSEAEKIATTLNSNKILAEINSWRGELNRVSGQNDKAIEYQEKAIKLATTINDYKRLSFSNISKGETYRIIGEFNKAIESYENAIAFASKTKDENKTTICYNSLGDLYRTINNFPKSLQYFTNGLELAEKNNNFNQMAFCLRGLGDLYIDQDESEKALSYYQKALSFTQNLGLKTQECNILSSIGIAYYNLKKVDLAIENLNDAIKIGEEIGYYDKIGFCNNIIGDIQKENGNYKEALIYYNKTLEFAKETNNLILIANTYKLMAENYFKLNDYSQCEKFAKLGMKISTDNQLLNNKKDYARLLADLFSSLQKYKEAYPMLTLFLDLKDSLNSADNIKKMASIEYSAKEKGLKAEQEAKVMTYEAEQVKKEAELQKQKAIRYAFTAGFVLVLILVGLVFRNLQQNKKKNKIITQQKIEVEKQKEIVDEKNKEITDSITYAKRLQEAILPPIKFVQQEFPESFILYKPKDIIAGDFYWMEKIDNTVFIAAADSTGHGVPGALVSVVCSNALNRSIKEFKLKDPGEILFKARELVLETFEKSEGEVKDGMDISLLTVERLNNEHVEIKWSGANNPLIYINSKGVNEIKPNKQSIGKTENPLPFISHKIVSEPDTTFYLITDGFADQFGGPKEKKYKSKQLYELFLRNKNTALIIQKNTYNADFEQWRGALEQIDDVTIIGLKI